MRKLATCIALVAAVGLSVLAAPRQAGARPQYHMQLKEKYAAVKTEADTKKCAVCHGGNNGANKKILSEYGKALKDALGMPNVKPAADIAKAMEKIEGKANGDGKKYGDLLKEGKLPAPAAAE
jgi:hypothetical protein